MAIPPFDRDGMLPAGRHTATPVDVTRALVKPFEGSKTRVALHRRWRDLHSEFMRVLKSDLDREWVGSAFVMNIISPDEIAVVVFASGDVGEYLTPSELARLRTLIDRHEWRGPDDRTLYVTIDLLPIVDEGHPDYDAVTMALERIHDEFRGVHSGAEHGYLVVT